MVLFFMAWWLLILGHNYWGDAALRMTMAASLLLHRYWLRCKVFGLIGREIKALTISIGHGSNDEGSLPPFYWMRKSTCKAKTKYLYCK